jgi:hypothetical protein
MPCNEQIVNYFFPCTDKYRKLAMRMVGEIRLLVWGKQQDPQQSFENVPWATQLIDKDFLTYQELWDIAKVTDIIPPANNTERTCPDAEAKSLENFPFCPGEAKMKGLGLCHTSKRGSSCQCIL